MSIRVIARLDIKGPNLVKGVHLEGLRVLGKPENFARKYYEQGADELIYIDAVASLYGRNSLVQVVERTAREVFIPLAVGGGLRSVDDIRAVLRAGADKVSLNTAAGYCPQLIREAANAFGSSTIIISIDAMRRPNGKYEVYVNYGREKTGLDAFDWAIQAAEMGAGELLVTSIDHEGSGRGFDIDFTRKIADSVPVPVIASGGAGKVGDLCRVIQEGRADAVSLASLLHYNYLERCAGGKLDFSGEGNVDFIRSGSGVSKFEATSLPKIKEYLLGRGIECRPVVEVSEV